MCGKPLFRDFRTDNEGSDRDSFGDDLYFSEDESGSGSTRGLQIQSPCEASPIFIVSKKRQISPSRFSFGKKHRTSVSSWWLAQECISCGNQQCRCGEANETVGIKSNRTIVDLFTMDSMLTPNKTIMHTSALSLRANSTHSRVSQFLQGDVVCSESTISTPTRAEPIIIDLTDD